MTRAAESRGKAGVEEARVGWLSRDDGDVACTTCCPTQSQATDALGGAPVAPVGAVWADLYEADCELCGRRLGEG